MKRSRVAVQTDLFNNVPPVLAFPNSPHSHDEIVRLLAKLLVEVAQMTHEHPQAEGEDHD